MSIIRKLFGVLLLLASIVGLIFSIAGITFLWRIEGNISASLQSTVEILSQTMETTSQGLDVTRTALEGSVTTISSLQSTVQTIATTVKSSTPMVAQIGTMMDTDFPETIQATQESLVSAAESAKVIDSLLSTLSSIPLIGAGLNYNPDVPLSDSLNDVATSLADLPASFRSMTENLETTATNLETFESDLTVMAASIGEIESSVAEYDKVIDGYKTSLKQVQSQLDSLKAGAPKITRYLLLALTVFLAWMAIANLGLLTQGWELLTEKKAVARKEIEDMVEEAVDKEEQEAKSDS